MRNKIGSLLVATTLGCVTAVVLATPAHAEPCGGSSWKEDVNTQTVAYRNCAPSSARVKGWITGGLAGPGNGPCTTVPGNGGSKYLLRVFPTFTSTLLPWGVKGC